MKKQTLLLAALMIIGLVIMNNNQFSWRTPQESTNFLGGVALTVISIGIFFFLKARTPQRKTNIAVAA